MKRENEEFSKLPMRQLTDPHPVNADPSVSKLPMRQLTLLDTADKLE